MVPESNHDSKFIYYAKKPTKGEKVKNKLKLIIVFFHLSKHSQLNFHQNCNEDMNRKVFVL